MPFRLRDPAVRIALTFTLVGGLWILLSDQLLTRMAHDSAGISHLATYMGWAFVLAVATILFFERKRSDRRLVQLAAIVQSSDDAIVGVDREARITSWNRGAEILYGYPEAEVIGRDISFLYPPDRADELKRFLEVHRTGRSVFHHETVRLRRDGRPVEVTLTASAVRDSAGRHLGTATIARDIGDRKRVEEAARMAEVGQLASGVAHEVRNPLNAMRMQLAVIRDMVESFTPDSADEIIDEIACVEHELLRVQNLASDFLAYGRPAAACVEEILVADFLAEIARFLRPEFEKEGIAVVVDGEHDDATVCCDPAKLRQVVLNLAENGRQAIPAGGGRVTLRWAAAPPDEVRLEVSDTGTGIPADQLPRVFDAFYSTREGGTGMGLAIVKRIVRAGGGRLQVNTAEGEGTAVVLHLPRVCPLASVAPSAASPNEAERTKP